MANRLVKKCSLCYATVRQLRNILPVTSKRYSSSSKNEAELADIVISGGGMVGVSMACALGHEELLKDKRIILLEAAPKISFTLQEKFANRTCTISPATIKLFQSVGAWEEIQSMRCHPVHRMQVWESCSNALITFNQPDMSEEMAYVAENDVILEGLTRRLEAIKENVEVWYDCRANKYEVPGRENAEGSPWAVVHLDNGKILKTKLLIGSDGFTSSVRQAAGFHTVKWNYNQRGLVATLKVSESENTVAWQRFLPTGPIAMLPLSNTVCNLIWTTTVEHAKELQAMEPDTFIDAVNDAFWQERDVNTAAVQVGEVLQNVWSVLSPESSSCRQLPPTVVGVEEKSRASFPLGLCLASNFVKARVALIGDAAHRMHPLAGQGVNLGFGDVACLRDTLVKATKDGMDLGSVSYLSEYETKRQRKVLPVAGTIDGLNRLYGTDFTPVVLLRSVGLQATNALTMLKDKIVKEASS